MAMEIKARIPVLFLREGDLYIARSPVLDIATQGTSYEEAKKNFEELLEIFWESLIEMGTLEQALLELGWQKTREGFVPPTIVGHETKDIRIRYGSPRARKLATV